MALRTSVRAIPPIKKMPKRMRLVILSIFLSVPVKWMPTKYQQRQLNKAVHCLLVSIHRRIRIANPFQCSKYVYIKTILPNSSNFRFACSTTHVYAIVFFCMLVGTWPRRYWPSLPACGQFRWSKFCWACSTATIENGGSWIARCECVHSRQLDPR